MRVGLVRSIALGSITLVGLGLAGCDDDPTDFDTDQTVMIETNPSAMVVPAGVTSTLNSRAENEGFEPTWEDVTFAVDASCDAATVPPATVQVDTAASYEPTIQPPIVLDVTGGTTIGTTCIELTTGSGVSTTVEVTVVGNTLEITSAPDTLTLFEQVQLGAVLLSADGTPISPFDPTTDLVWETDDEDVLTVDQTGLLTSAGGIGGGVVTATWTGSGVDVVASHPVAINSPTLNILNVPAGNSLLILTTVDLDVELVNPTDPPVDFGPFDQNTDVTWSSSNDDAVEVDAQTGEATAVGAGTATITVTWNDGEAVTASVDITVDVPTPTLSSTDVASADALDVVTITGTDFIPGVHTVLIDGAMIDAFYAPTIVDATTATFMMPGGAAADLDVSVGVAGGVESNAATVSRTCGASDESCASEPDNDTAAGAPDVGALPVSFAGFVDGTDSSDLLEFTLAAETTFDINLDWTGVSGDMDVVFTTTGAMDFSEAECGFATATGAQPETGQCTLAAGTYFLWVATYDLGLAFYELNLVEVP